MAKNYLLGYGEEFSSKINRPQIKNNKVDIYSYEENKTFLLQRLEELKDKVSQVPKQAKANGQVVTKIVLHPAYLAKSFYPESFLKNFSLKDIGSKPVKIEPRKAKGKKKVSTTTCMFISGSQDSLMQLKQALENDELNKTQQADLIKIEDIELLEGHEKVKSLSEKNASYEAVLHTPPYDREKVINQFRSFAKECGCVFNSDVSIKTGGLTFLSLKSSSSSVEKVSEFTYLRAIRIMPQLGLHRPVVDKELIEDSSIKLPQESAINSKIRVAVFDGGIGSNTISKWCTEYKFNDQDTPQSNLEHGSEVTSLALFGHVQEGQEELPRPYTNIEHYRVIDSAIDPHDVDSLDVLARIISILDNNKFDFINLSLGPRLPIEDDEVHSWTSALEPYLSDGTTLMTVAVGNDGHLGSPQKSRVQVPADLVNALAVGSASSDIDDFWSPADYSCVGPGRSPGIVKPDIVTFGGNPYDMVKIYSPLHNKLTLNAGTSFSSVIALRAAIGVKVMLADDQPTLLSKALLIHSTNRNGHHWHNVGRGKVPSDINKIIYTEDNEATIIYKDIVPQSGCKRLRVPMPDIMLKGQVTLKATFCYATKAIPEHPYNYTNSGLHIKFRPEGPNGKTETFYSNKSIYQDEESLRAHAHKWENTLHNEFTFEPDQLVEPCFEIDHQEREGGNKTTGAPPLPFILVVSIKASGSPDLYNSIIQKHQVLQPLRTQVEIPVLT